MTFIAIPQALEGVSYNLSMFHKILRLCKFFLFLQKVEISPHIKKKNLGGGGLFFTYQ